MSNIITDITIHISQAMGHQAILNADAAGWLLQKQTLPKHCMQDQQQEENTKVTPKAIIGSAIRQRVSKAMGVHYLPLSLLKQTVQIKFDGNFERLRTKLAPKSERYR